MKPISVVIPTFNKPEYLKRTINALLRQLGEQDEVIVVNDGGMHPSLPDGVQYVWQEREGYRLATARNKGIVKAGNPYVVTLDDDCLPDPDFLEAYRKRIKPNLLLLGGLRFEYDPKETTFNWPPEMPRTRERSEYIPLLHGKLEGGYGGNMCFNRKDAIAVGGFDERFNGCWGYEDTGFVKVMMCRGVVVEKCFEAMATHLYHAPTFTEECKDRNRALMAEFAGEYERGIYPKWQYLG